MATDVAADEFVTIVPVGDGRPVVHENNFVTVLTVGAAAGAAEVKVHRSKGERLGLGLKFEGGSAAAEKVRRLLVQSCAEHSPAANATTPWGKLIPGDEILAIDGVPVFELTRIDCVRRLKDSDESLTLLVRHFEYERKACNVDVVSVDAPVNAKSVTEIVRPSSLPPPVPPRKLGKKNSFKDKSVLQTVGEKNTILNDNPNTIHDKDNMNSQHNSVSNITKLSRKSSFDSHIHRQTKEGGIAYLKKGSPEEVRRLVRRLSDGKVMPPEAEVYMDLLSTEWERCLVLAEVESDDTGSSISTVVDRLGSMTSSVENSIPSTPIMQHKTIDIQKVLNCIENIDSSILNDIAGGQKFLEKQVEINKDSENNQFHNGLDTIEATTVASKADETGRTYHKFQQNDKNNNNTVVDPGNFVETIKPLYIRKSVEHKIESVTEKPKPMPRNAKIERSVSERKPKPIIQLPDSSPSLVPDSLLTPTKKTCIETWLQRSEAEMNNKHIEKIEDSCLPEILPRLIDFVPKTQFKECNEIPLPRPLTAPPPPPAPPVETREDGSGASLDTIGELDESTDVTDNAKTEKIENETKERNVSFERSFWEDRVSKSDAEDKSLSNDETPLPSCPRQPPDGVETPTEAVEKILEPPSRLPPRIPTAWPTTRSRYSYSSRSQDARSEASVKDKIAMFSNGRAISTEQLDKCGTLPARVKSDTRKSAASFTSNYTDILSLDRRLTKSQDNLDELPRAYNKHRDRPEVLGAIENTNTSSLGIPAIQPLYEDKKPSFYTNTATLASNADTSTSRPVYHMRSISDDSNNVTNSKHKSNLEYLIEQRKKSMSKLKCLAIPETQGPIIDLPEIKIQGTLTKSFLTTNSKQNNVKSKENKVKIGNEMPNETKWKVNLLPNNIPKYSPAFKRKSLQVYTPSNLSKESTPDRKFCEKVNNFSKVISYAAKPIRTTLDFTSDYVRNSSLTLPAKSTSSKILTKNENRNNNNYLQDYKNVEIKICTATEIIDSDNDSAMSSTQSSYRSSASSPMHNVEPIESDNSQLSPRISHYTPYALIKPDSPTKSSVLEKNCEEFIKRNVCRSVSSDTNVSLSSSAGSGATSGSQASCSSLESSAADSDKRRISKTYNIDTINRRNILASAKCRSGRDAKLNSPVIESKFTHESHDKSPSPADKPSERLSTLTSSVSALSNKGECRRRNKVIAESDSDSDCDINVRQRKSDFKNSRLKRNSSLGNKTKTNETEDTSKTSSEKVKKEMSNVSGLDYLNNNMKNNIDKKINEPLKPDKRLISNELSKKITSIDTTGECNRNIVTKSTSVKGNFTSTLDKLSNIIATDKTDGISENEILHTHTIRLKRGVGAGVGLILAGGVDCEAKDVTVYRVLEDSIAAKAGLKRGAKVRSINGFSMTGLTHAQSVTILKEQRSEVVIELDNETQDNGKGKGCDSEKAESKARQEVAEKKEASLNVVTVILEKAGGGAGLGFGLDGGRDSPHGDRPLTVKKLFAGGAAAQSGRILVGAELLSAGGQSMERYTRTQAWAALKGLPVGPVALVLRNPKTT
ncbi:hypothetical protein ACJJTC_007937 [Scirpophaga incertulas]